MQNNIVCGYHISSKTNEYFIPVVDFHGVVADEPFAFVAAYDVAGVCTDKSFQS